MVTMNDYAGSVNDFSMTLFGLSTDEKPTGSYKNVDIGNGSSFYEMDTATLYMFDEEAQEWLKQ